MRKQRRPRRRVDLKRLMSGNRGCIYHGVINGLSYRITISRTLCCVLFNVSILFWLVRGRSKKVEGKVALVGSSETFFLGYLETHNDESSAVSLRICFHYCLLLQDIRIIFFWLLRVSHCLTSSGYISFWNNSFSEHHFILFPSCQYSLKFCSTMNGYKIIAKRYQTDFPSPLIRSLKGSVTNKRLGRSPSIVYFLL
jgi:hypothetical protein